MLNILAIITNQIKDPYLVIDLRVKYLPHTHTHIHFRIPENPVLVIFGAFHFS